MMPWLKGRIKTKLTIICIFKTINNLQFTSKISVTKQWQRHLATQIHLYKVLKTGNWSFLVASLVLAQCELSSFILKPSCIPATMRFLGSIWLVAGLLLVGLEVCRAFSSPPISDHPTYTDLRSILEEIYEREDKENVERETSVVNVSCALVCKVWFVVCRC